MIVSQLFGGEVCNKNAYSANLPKKLTKPFIGNVASFLWQTKTRLDFRWII